VEVARDIPFTAHDDDDDSLFDTARLPNVGYLNGALSEAYVVPAYNTPGISNYNDLRPFKANLTDTLQKENADAGWGSKNVRARDLWVTYLLAAYQGSAYQPLPNNVCDCDLDPNNEGSIVGRTWLGLFNPHGMTTFIEVIREVQLANNLYSMEEIDGIAVVHEMGHLLSRDIDEPITTLDQMPVACVPQCVPQYEPRIIAEIRVNKEP
jgi:hypothetical protein